jgi:hypothetical protein
MKIEKICAYSMRRICCNRTAFLSRRPAHTCRRIGLPHKRLMFLICVPAVLCSLPKEVGNFERGNIQSKVLSKFQLRRSISLPSCMNQHAKSLNSVNYNIRIPIYSPVHSPPTEFAQGEKGRCDNSKEPKPRNINKDTSRPHLAAQQSCEGPSCPTEVFTKIQTQLYPQMHF